MWAFECVCIDADESTVAHHNKDYKTVTQWKQQQVYLQQESTGHGQQESRKEYFKQDKVLMRLGDVYDDLEDLYSTHMKYSNPEYTNKWIVDSFKWKWPEGFKQFESLQGDSRKMTMIAEVQTQIDLLCAKRNYHKLAQACDFVLDNTTIVRYLEAVLWQPPSKDVKSAADRIAETIDWRVSFPLPTTDINLLRTELATGKNIVHGKAKDGRPIVYLLLGRENTWEPRGNVAALVYTLDRAIASMDVNTSETICIVDCKGIGMSNAPATSFLTSVVSILGKHYPRRNGQIFICNVSSIVYFVWNMISQALSEVARQKVVLLTGDVTEMKTKIGAIVDLDQLWTEFGGNAALEFEVDAYLQSDPRLKL